jgi:hypothetical protein
MMKFNPKNWPLMVTAIGAAASAFWHIDDTKKAAIILVLAAVGAMFGLGQDT